jgi:type IV pilus assembly protein PilC
MLSYTYVARDAKTGEKISAEIEAEDEHSAAKLLIDRGLSPLTIEGSKKAEPGAGLRNRIHSKDKVIFSRQLSTLVNSGLPLVQSLNTVIKQTKNKNLKAILNKVISDVEGGSSFTIALSKYPMVFNDVYISLVAAGEASGTLDMSLERLANQLEKDAELVSKVRGAMIYPAIVLGVLFAVATFMSVKVLPQVVNLYKNLPGAKLPFVTRLMLGFSHSLTHFWWLATLIVIVIVFYFLHWKRTPQGKHTLDRIKLSLWPIAPLMHKLYMARFTRTGSTLIASGVPMIKMLNTTAEAIGNSVLQKSVNEAADKVKGGKNLSDSIRGEPYFLDLVPDMIRVGEQSGQLESMMSKVADYYEKEVDNEVKAISTIIEPLLMIVVGILALIIVVAVLLPIYSLAGKNLGQGL